MYHLSLQSSPSRFLPPFASNSTCVELWIHCKCYLVEICIYFQDILKNLVCFQIRATLLYSKIFLWHNFRGIWFQDLWNMLLSALHRKINWYLFFEKLFFPWCSAISNWQPNQQRWYAKWKRSVGICTHCMHVFARLAPDLCAQSVLISKISASELRRKFIKSALLVGLVQKKTWLVGWVFPDQHPVRKKTNSDFTVILFKNSLFLGFFLGCSE